MSKIQIIKMELMNEARYGYMAMVGCMPYSGLQTFTMSTIRAHNLRTHQFDPANIINGDD